MVGAAGWVGLWGRVGWGWGWRVSQYAIDRSDRPSGREGWRRPQRMARSCRDGQVRCLAPCPFFQGA